MLTWEKEVSKLVEPIMKQIMGLQFIQGFINADLPREKFAAYLAQDILYCKEYQSFLVTLSEKDEEENANIPQQDIVVEGEAQEKNTDNN